MHLLKCSKVVAIDGNITDCVVLVDVVAKRCNSYVLVLCHFCMVIWAMAAKYIEAKPTINA